MADRPTTPPPPLPRPTDGSTGLVAGALNNAAKRRYDSVGALVVSNLVTIVIALVQQWPIGLVMWIYWCQSVTIGVFMALRMAALRNFSTEGLKINDRSVEPTPSTRRQTVAFFIFHYGFFHFGYFVFLAGVLPATEDLIWMLICVGTFVANHAASFRYNVEADLKGRPNIGTLMFLPYARVVPMHLCIGLAAATGAAAVGALVFFLLLKTLADVVMHVVEHRLYRKATPPPI